jgi:hypothetical protein
MISGTDPFAPTVFKEGNTSMPLVGPNPKTLLPFYVSETTIFKFAIETQSIMSKRSSNQSTPVPKSTKAA